MRQGALAIVFVGARRMQRLNRDYHGRDRLTDVLAFDVATRRQRGSLLADVVIAPAVAARVAPQYRHSYQAELLTYVAHGILHLLGWRDHAASARRRMWRAQARFVRESR